MVRGTFSPARAWRLAVGPASTRTLGVKVHLPGASPRSALHTLRQRRKMRRCELSPRPKFSSATLPGCGKTVSENSSSTGLLQTPPPPQELHPQLYSAASQVLRRDPTSRADDSWSYAYWLHHAHCTCAPSWFSAATVGRRDIPVPDKLFPSMHEASDRAGPAHTSPSRCDRCSLRHGITASAPQTSDFAAQYSACPCPCQRFVCAVTVAYA